MTKIKKIKKFVVMALCCSLSMNNLVFAGEWEDKVSELDKSKQPTNNTDVILKESLSDKQKEQLKNIEEKTNNTNLEIQQNRVSSSSYVADRQFSVTDEDGYSHIVKVNSSCDRGNCEKYTIVSSDKKATITEITPKMQEDIESQIAMTSSNGTVAKNAIMYSSMTAIATSNMPKKTKALMFLMALSQANQAKTQADKIAKANEDAKLEKDKQLAKQEEINKRTQNYENKVVSDSKEIASKVILNPPYPMVSDFLVNDKGEVAYDSNNEPLTKPIYATIKVNTNEKIKTIIVNLPEMNHKISVANGEEFMVEQNRTLGEKTFSYEVTTETGKVEKGSLTYKVSQYANALTSDKKATNFTPTYIIGNGNALTANDQKVDVAGQLGKSTYANNVCSFSITADNQTVSVENSAISQEGCNAQNERMGEYILVENGYVKINDKGESVVFSDTDEMRLNPITKDIYDEMVNEVNSIINETQSNVDVLAYNEETKEIKRQVLGMEGHQYVNVQGVSVPINLNNMSIEYANGKSISPITEKQLIEKGINTSGLRLGVDGNGIGYIWDDNSPNKTCVSCLPVKSNSIKERNDSFGKVISQTDVSVEKMSVNGYTK